MGDLTVDYFIDLEGRLWKGPSNPDDNLHYARCEGLMDRDKSLIWVLRRSSKDPSWAPFETPRSTQ